MYVHSIDISHYVCGTLTIFKTFKAYILVNQFRQNTFQCSWNYCIKVR